MRKQQFDTSVVSANPAQSTDPLIRHIAARRQPVSALKSVCILTAALAAGTAQAASFIVDTTRDGPVGSVDGCSLREAIHSINAAQDLGGCTHSGGFGSGDNVDLSELHGTIHLGRNAPIDITKPVGISGPALAANGKPSLTIRGNQSRIFNIGVNADTLIGNLKLTGGSTAGDNEPGGAIFSQSVLGLSDCEVSGNHTTGAGSHGGAVYVYNDALVIQSTVSGNQATANSSFGGGLVVAGNLGLINSTVSGNKTQGEHSSGGGLYVFANATLTNSTVSGNQTQGEGSTGGGLFVHGNATLTNSTVSGNLTKGEEGSGGGLAVNGDLTLANSTVSANLTKGQFSGGGGMAVFGVTSITNSTISGNKTSAPNSFGGGLFAAGNFTLTNSTIAFNSSKSGADGVFTPTAKTFTANNSIIAQSGNGEVACSTTIDAGSSNLIANKDGNDNSCGGNSSQVTLKELHLDSLKDNDGPTKTHALKAGSKAIDNGDDAVCPSADQRGIARPQGPHCDIGSYEF